MSSNLRTYLSAFILATVFALPVSSSAVGYITLWDPLQDAYLRTLQQNKDNYERWYGKAKPKKSSKKATKTTQSTKSTQTTSSVKTQTGAHRYKHSSAISREIHTEMIALVKSRLQKAGALTPQAQSELNQLSKRDLLGELRRALANDGYEPNSLATALSTWVTVNYGIIKRSDMTSLQAHGLVNQLATALDSETSLAQMSSADKQRLAERLYWLSTVQMGMYLEAQRTGNSTHLNALTKDAHSSLSAVGLSANQLGIGSRGLELR